MPSGQEPNNPQDVFHPYLKLVIKEDVLPQEQLPQFPAVERLAETGLLAVDTWNSKREIVNFKATIEIPMLGSTIENSGDVLHESHMSLGWLLSIDGAVRQESYDPGIGQHAARVRSKEKLHGNQPQGNPVAHNSVWNKKHMEPIQGYTLKQLRKDAEPYISRKTSRSSEVSEGALLRKVRELNSPAFHHRMRHLCSGQLKNGSARSVKTRPPSAHSTRWRGHADSNRFG